MSPIEQEKRWQREDDARTLIQAEKIKQDKARLDGAKQEAARLLKERENETNVLRKLAGGKGATKPKAGGTKLTTNPGLNWINKK